MELILLERGTLALVDADVRDRLSAAYAELKGDKTRKGILRTLSRFACFLPIHDFLVRSALASDSAKV